MNNNTTCNIREVAAHAGVSVGTVSRALNGGNGVRNGTLKKVMQAASELNYELPPNRPVHKTSLNTSSTNGTGNIGLYFATMKQDYANHPVSAAYLVGLSKCCNDYGLHPITEYSRDDRTVPSIVEQRKIDALIVKGETTDDWLVRIAQFIPVVMLNSHQHDRLFDTVNCDDHHSGFDVARYLWNVGHRRIAFLGGTPKHNMHIMRMHGFEQFLRIHDGYDPQLVQITSVTSVNQSEPQKVYPLFTEQLAQWMQRPEHERPTAVVAANDWVAAGIYRSMEMLGYHIPDDLSVVGFDNLPGLCEGLLPPLTSYEIQLADAADIAARILVAKLNGQWFQTQPVLQLVAGKIVKRDSVRAV